MMGDIKIDVSSTSEKFQMCHGFVSSKKDGSKKHILHHIQNVRSNEQKIKMIERSSNSPGVKFSTALMEQQQYVTYRINHKKQLNYVTTRWISLK